MGIKYLNSYFTERCSAAAIHKTHLSAFRNKVLAIDTSIYLYKFVEKDALHENLYLMISIFRKYGVVPVFVFDGKPPPEKKELLIKRKKEKDAAEEKWNALKAETEDNVDVMDAEERAKAEQEMERLKKRFVRIKDTDIANAKRIMDAYGAFYVEAHGESDQLCAYLVKHRFAHACVSDDMDMFLYGCDRVLRHLSLVTHDATEYVTAVVLNELGIDEPAFRDILILSGTDYNMHETVKLTELFRLHECWKTMAHSPNGPSSLPFVEWARHHCFVKVDTEKMERVRAMFSTDEYIRQNRELLKQLVDALPFADGPTNVDALKEVMREDGFLFAQ